VGKIYVSSSCWKWGLGLGRKTGDPSLYDERVGRCDMSSANSTEIIEEAPAPGLSAELKKDLAEKAVAAAKAVD
jgi:hypothetical protein